MEELKSQGCDNLRRLGVGVAAGIVFVWGYPGLSKDWVRAATPAEDAARGGRGFTNGKGPERSIRRGFTDCSTRLLYASLADSVNESWREIEERREGKTWNQKVKRKTKQKIDLKREEKKAKHRGINK